MNDLLIILFQKYANSTKNREKSNQMNNLREQEQQKKNLQEKVITRRPRSMFLSIDRSITSIFVLPPPWRQTNKTQWRTGLVFTVWWTFGWVVDVRWQTVNQVYLIPFRLLCSCSPIVFPSAAAGILRLILYTIISVYIGDWFDSHLYHQFRLIPCLKFGNFKRQTTLFCFPPQQLFFILFSLPVV